MANTKDKWEDYYISALYYRVTNETFGYLIIPENCIVNGLNIGLWEKSKENCLRKENYLMKK